MYCDDDFPLSRARECPGLPQVRSHLLACCQLFSAVSVTVCKGAASSIAGSSPGGLKAFHSTCFLAGMCGLSWVQGD